MVSNENVSEYQYRFIHVDPKYLEFYFSNEQVFGKGKYEGHAEKIGLAF